MFRVKSNQFETQYTTWVSVGTVKQVSGFYDDDAGEFTEIAGFYADIQPYNTQQYTLELTEKEYGQTERATLKMFCPYLPQLVLPGKIARIAGQEYTIFYAEHWEKGSVAFLRERE